MSPIPKRKTERAPAIEKLIKPSIGVGLAVFAYVAIKNLSAEIPRINVEDEVLLREIFFGEGGSGKNYAILCHNDSHDTPISSVFLDARNGRKDSIPSGLEFGVLDCKYILPSSGKTVAQRFGLDLTQRPTIFVSGRTGAPIQIPQKHLRTGNMLLKALRSLLEPHTAKIDNTKTLKNQCLNKDYCAVLLKGEKTPEKHVKDAIQNLIVQYPKIQFASLDASVLLMTNLEQHLDIYTKGVHQLIMFKKVSGSLNTDAETNKTGSKNSGRLISSVATFKGGAKNFKYSALNSFISDATSGKTEFKKIPALPNVKTRTKKAEEAEKKKRDRLMQQKKDAQQQAEKQKSGFFDSTKDQRKADRDRLRQEHNEKNNVKPLTPEEIKEKEQARRKRMEEEAAKWNVMEEDAPETGDIIEDEETLDFEDGEEVLDMDEDDVMDLD